MRLDLQRILPHDPNRYSGFRAIRWILAIYLIAVVGRSTIHLVASDGGANSIAGIDVSVAGGDNIIAIFHQWGATQLLLALFLVLLFFRYPGLTPLILLSLSMDPVVRAIAGQFKAVTAAGTPPGESLNWIAFYFISALFIASLVEKKSKKD
jgi:hypothetical protein